MEPVGRGGREMGKGLVETVGKEANEANRKGRWRQWGREGGASGNEFDEASGKGEGRANGK